MVGKITHGLVVRPEPLRLILDGAKVWELRGTRTSRRGPIALIEGGSGKIVGVADLADVIGPMTGETVTRNAEKTGYRVLPVTYPNFFAWVLRSAKRLPRAVSYTHPAGAVIWVRLTESVSREVGAEAADLGGTR